MFNRRGARPLRLLVVISYLVMIICNMLANTLPINGFTTGGVSDAYPNLFAPAGITFSIWGIIYLLLFGYVLYHIGFLQNGAKIVNTDLLRKAGKYFVISSFANALWIVAWHYQLILVAMVLMIVILFCLIAINSETNSERITGREKILVRLPFSVYFGWITVATIANVTVLLVSLGWRGYGLPETFWTAAIIVIGAIIGIITTHKNHDFAYGLVLIWAYSGILTKHLSKEGFAGQYPEVVITTIACLVLLVFSELYLLRSGKKKLEL